MREELILKWAIEQLLREDQPLHLRINYWLKLNKLFGETADKAIKYTKIIKKRDCPICRSPAWFLWMPESTKRLIMSSSTSDPLMHSQAIHHYDKCLHEVNRKLFAQQVTNN